MTQFLLVFIIFLAIVLIMAVGFIFQKKSISGSCGGITALGVEKACNCENPCENKKKRMAKEQQWQENRIV